MSKTDVRLRILYLGRILFEHTDENNYMQLPKIAEQLELYGIKTDRRVLYADIETLRVYGMDILYQKGKGYAVVNREFETAELKLLADAVSSAKFISASKSKALIRKIKKLSSVSESKKISKGLSVYESGKTLNKSVFMNIEKIQTAIDNKKQISFRYFGYNVKKEKEYKEERKNCSPYLLVCDDNQYYAVSYYPARPEKPVNFRVDRMEDIKILEKNAQELFADFSRERYVNSTFDMFSGEEKRVELEFVKENKMVNIVLERFGMDILITETDENHFTVNPVVRIGDGFYSWLFKLGKAVRLLGPDDVKEKYKEKLKETLEIYK